MQYIIDFDGSSALTSTGGVRTRCREDNRFKLVYLSKPPRNLSDEYSEDVVSELVLIILTIRWSNLRKK